MTDASISATPAAIAAAFTEWDRRYRENPEAFMAEARRLLNFQPHDYGKACAPYFIKLVQEVNAGAAEILGAAGSAHGAATAAAQGKAA